VTGDVILSDMMDEFIIREMNRNDLKGLLALYRHYGESQLPIEDLNRANKYWSRIETDQNIIYFVCEFCGMIVSSCFLLIFPQLTRDGQPYGLIENVITHNDYRKKGYATALLKHSLKIAWEKNCYQVMLMTGNKQAEAINLYKKVGFQAGIKEGFIAYRQ
jgi:predicted GNAT family acetyltransferase